MKRRNVELPKAPDVIKRRVTHGGSVAVKCAAVLLVTAAACLFAIWGSLYLILCGPSPTARDRLVHRLEESAVTEFIPEMFLDSETVEEILSAENGKD